VVATPEQRTSLADEDARDIAELLGEHAVARIQTPPQGDDPAAERRLRAEALVAVAGGRPEPLERLRYSFIDRLRRASDDFAATEGLRVVETALSLVFRPDGVWGSGRHDRYRPRWRRRKSSR
jgi:hypothetical protein